MAALLMAGGPATGTVEVDGGGMWKRHEPDIELKSPEQFAAMREAGLVVAAALRAAAAAAAPGVSTADLDAVASEVILAAGAVPSFKGYYGYPATLCTSVNEEIVHGIPGPGPPAPGWRPAVHRLRRDRGRLARRRRAQPRDRRTAPRPGPAAGRLRAGDVGRAGPGPPRRAADRHLARRRGHGPGRGPRLRDRRGLRGALHRQRDAHGTAGAEPGHGRAAGRC